MLFRLTERFINEIRGVSEDSFYDGQKESIVLVIGEFENGECLVEKDSGQFIKRGECVKI